MENDALYQGVFFRANQKSYNEQIKRLLSMNKGTKKEHKLCRIYGDTRFKGACIDYGAEKSVIGVHQEAAYTKYTGRQL